MIREINYRICKIIDGIETDVTDYVTGIGTIIQAMPSKAKLDPYVIRGGTLNIEGTLDLDPQIGDIFRIYLDNNKIFEGVVPKHNIFKKENHKVEFEIFSYMYAMKKCDASYSHCVVRSLDEYISTKLVPYGYNTIFDFDNFENTDNPIQSFIPPEIYKDENGWGKIGAFHIISGSPESGEMVYAIGVGKHIAIYSWSDYGKSNICLLDYATGEDLNEPIYDDIIKVSIDSEDYLIALLTVNNKSSENGIERRVLYEIIKIRISDNNVTTDYPRPPGYNPNYFTHWGVREGSSKMWLAWNEETGDYAGRLWYAWYDFEAFNYHPNHGNRYGQVVAISDNFESENKFYIIVNDSVEGYCLHQIDVFNDDPYVSCQSASITDMPVEGDLLAVGEESDMYFISSWHKEDSGFENGQIIKINLNNFNIFQLTNGKKIAGLKHFDRTPGLTCTEVFINSGDSKGWELKQITSSGIEDKPICSNINLTVCDRNRIWVLEGAKMYRIMLYEDENLHALQSISNYVIRTVYGKMQYSIRKAYEELAKAWNCIFFIDSNKNIVFIDGDKWIARNRTEYNIEHYLECVQNTLYDYDYVTYNGYTVGNPGVTVRGLNVNAECLEHIPHLCANRAQAIYALYGKMWNYWQLLIEHDGNPYSIEDYVKFAGGEGIVKGVMVDNTGIHLEVMAPVEEEQ